MKFQTLAPVLSSTVAIFTHAATAQKTICAGTTGEWFSMAVYPQIHNATYDSTFDMGYYSQQQMPWIYSLFKPFGMTGYTITTLGLDAPYSTLTLMYFPTAEQFEEALAAHGDEIFARVPLFSSEYPPHYIGQVYNITV
ncbi:hypothetical protein BBK36DRAFT_145466 [Trichoderma citrinoviride]|uniref:NIPSNAP domain-containing protein n=1 Tax=Trichoderma citrinoviride TaxID=58853 RepID=A0A2T4B294_9HYPO|nr:hypothetical protein BBK36DRAFT_145466 [Trichoderma citrinoviride]PTB63434.1 hypothetical protein BBK36DRAFT_145466 [Trichoderma citrinoviride]